MASKLFLIPLLPLIGALINLTVGRKLSRGFVHAVAVASVSASLGVVLFTLYELWGVYKATGYVGGELRQVVYTWIEVGNFKVELAFRMDTLSAVMCFVVTFIGTLIHIYSTGYMADEKRYAAYFGYLNLFMGSMLILVLGSNLPVMFIGWEGVGVCSFLLIGFYFEREDYANAGRKAFVVNRIGDFAFLLGMFLLYWATKDLGAGNSLDFATLSSDAAKAAYGKSFWGGERLAAAAGILLFIGACGKSAQIPLYVWLPDAMAGPTPVSALIHAATMVTAGVYMVARMSVLFSMSTTALIVVSTIGLLTALTAAFYAFAQTDLKKVLAYSTVSQLGFMFVAVGTGNYAFGIFHVVTHAFFKAGLFLGAGSVMHAMSGSGDIMKMGGLRKRLPITHATFLIYCLAIAGFPGLAGFFSKDEILAGAYAAHLDGWPAWYGKFLWAGLTVAALGTAFYMWRLYFLVFAGECRADEETQHHIHESPFAMTFPLVVLAIGTVLVGWLGMPHLWHAHGWQKVFHGVSYWLDPSVADAPTVAGAEHLTKTKIIWLMITATVVGLAGIFMAWRIYGKGPSAGIANLVEHDPNARALYQASKNKLWVDELYEKIILGPFRWLARGLFQLVDRFLIDTVLVNGSAMAVSVFGRVTRWIQNGQVQRYMVGIILGAALIFFLTGRAAHPGISYRFVPEGVELQAYPGSGLAGEGATLRWDLRGDGAWDLTPEAEARLAAERAKGNPAPKIDPRTDYLDDPLLVRPTGEVGPFVRLEITDKVSGKAKVVTTHVVFPAAKPGAAAPSAAKAGGK
jgi:NADH-quinone oxidoreductase subunit L